MTLLPPDTPLYTADEVQEIINQLKAEIRQALKDNTTEALPAAIYAIVRDDD